MAATASLALSGCGKLQGLNTPVTPLARIQVQVTDPDSVLQNNSPQLRVALVWGAQWLPEPFCVAPPEEFPPVVFPPDGNPPSLDAVVANGCPDNFRFVPARAGADVPIQPDATATIDLINLPGADVMVGDLTARIAYASLVVYDDRNGNGILDFHHPPHHQSHEEHYNPGTPDTRDHVWGASFISMTKPDQRVAFREGGPPGANFAFYPRIGCPDPPPRFSILSAGGFSMASYLAAAAEGQLPAEASCGAATLDESVVTIRLSAPFAPAGPAGDAGTDDDAGVNGDAGAAGDAGTQVEINWPLEELACTDPESGGTTFYVKPDTRPDFTNPWACVGFPHLPGDTAGVTSGQQLVTASPPDGPCQGVIHYTLRGCDNDPNCPAPGWDSFVPPATPPDWWPCSTTP